MYDLRCTIEEGTFVIGKIECEIMNEKSNAGVYIVHRKSYIVHRKSFPRYIQNLQITHVSIINDQPHCSN